jgi:peptide deformylase
MFEIILEEQTPNLEPMEDALDWIAHNKGYLESFLKFARSQEHAIGLASNQVAYNGQRINRRFAAVLTTAGWTLAIDPKVVKTEGELFEAKEGCLTWPGKSIAAQRYPSVDVEFYTIEGEKHTRHADLKIEAQVWQHEINHLNGVEENVVPNDHWTVKRDGPKIGRNDKCPCESGRKFKKCCGK